MTAVLLKVFIFGFIVGAISSPLEDYVQKDDGYYKYEVLWNYTYHTPGVTSYILNMTSQKWLTVSDVPHTIWWHYVTVNIPHTLDPSMKNSALLYISDGNNTAVPEPETDLYITTIRMAALASNSITAVVNQVPNCCMRFKNDPLHMVREPDAMVALTWRLFYDNPHRPEFAINFPMTKAAVKAMDTVTDFILKKEGVTIKHFCVGGGSKRGFAAWSTAAVDKRVRGLLVVNYNLLHFRRSLHYQFRSYGGWSFPWKPVVDLNMTEKLDDENSAKYFNLVDPMAYKDRLTLPKFLIQTTGDEAFMPDNFRNFLTELMGPTYVNLVPNAEHSCIGHLTQIFFNLNTFYVSIMQEAKLPKVSWKTSDTVNGGKIIVTTDSKPMLLRAWHATTISKKRRDFRLLIANMFDPKRSPLLQPVIWRTGEVKHESEFSYSYEMDNPYQGWTAFFIQLTIPMPNGKIFECTTELKVIPSTLPFAECSKDGCHGTLV